VPGQLTTHVLDTSSGSPAGGLRFTLFRFQTGFASHRNAIAEGVTGSNGRSPGPILADRKMVAGAYCLEFDAESYFKAVRQDPVEGFLGLVPINFRIIDPETHYHVPLILSPFGYSTYRGS
jgi:5-hydroxyisourate hydrolase